MADINQIARGICSRLESTYTEKDVLVISAALREYGEAEYKRGFDQGYVYVDVKKADAEGYERGKKEIRDACSQHQHEQYADGYRRGVEEAIKVTKGYGDVGREIEKELQRGKGEGA